MLTRILEVEEILNGKVKVRFEKQAACACCRIFSFCGDKNDTLIIEAGPLPLKRGDRLKAGVESRKILLAAVLAFLLPGVIFLIGLFSFRSWGELPSFLFALGGICVYYGVLKLGLKKFRQIFTLKILEKL